VATVRRAGRTGARSAPTSSRPRRPTAIVNLQDQQAPRHKKWCVFGESDAGKTVLAGTAPNALFLTADVEGTESARAMGSTADELKINTFPEFVEAVDWIVRGDAHKSYEWFAVDTVDEVEELCWLDQLVSDDLKRASKYQPNKGDYPVVWKKVKEQLMALNRAPVNVLFVAHVMRLDKETEDGEDTVTLAMPQMGSTKRGDLSTYFCSQMGLVGYMRKVVEEGGAVQRQLLTQSGPRWLAKDRSTRLGSGMTDPTVPAMLAKMASAPGTTARRRPRRATA
jgi:hypothetical protein